MEFKAVIGANYGDEGKGMVCEVLCRSSRKPVIVMTNGGCQRGHTVDMPGCRHVFHHFGSGTMLGVPTYFPASYLMNPMKYVEEYTECEAAGFWPVCMRSPRCLMQVPSDILINRVLESSRADRHGSVGWGIWEAVLRAREGWGVSVEEFSRLSLCARKSLCREIMSKFTEKRLFGSGVKMDDGLYSRMRGTMDSDGFLEHFSQDFDFMWKSSGVMPLDDLLCGDFSAAVFENSQGLLLDCGYSGDMIHSTPSSVGMNGVVECLKADGLQFEDISVGAEFTAYYVSRTYLTRHGTGPFREEITGASFADATNKENDWQGKLRFGRFDSESCGNLLDRIKKDAGVFPNTNPKLVLTHCDEVHPPEFLAARADAFLFGKYPETGIF